MQNTSLIKASNVRVGKTWLHRALAVFRNFKEFFYGEAWPDDSTVNSQEGSERQNYSSRKELLMMGLPVLLDSIDCSGFRGPKPVFSKSSHYPEPGSGRALCLPRWCGITDELTTTWPTWTKFSWLPSIIFTSVMVVMWCRTACSAVCVNGKLQQFYRNFIGTFSIFNGCRGLYLTWFTFPNHAAACVFHSELIN